MASVLKSRAFTLIEILVVLLIVSIVLGTAALSLRSTGRVLACQQVEQLARVLSQLNQAAILQQQIYALRIRPQAVSVFLVQPAVDASDPADFVPVQSPDFTVSDWSRIAWQVRSQPAQGDVLFFKDGTVTPYTWSLWSADTGLVTVTMNTIGHVSVTGGCAAYA